MFPPLLMEIDNGAEAIIDRQGNEIVKRRIVKAYRIPEIDTRLRKLRARAEGRILERLSQAGFPVPSPLDVDESEMSLRMSFLDGTKLRDALNESNYRDYAAQIATLLTRLHEADVIHGDLTTSNMIVVGGKVHLIDFGLSYVSKKVEDKAVDLHLLQRALDSYHHAIAEEAFSIVLAHYSDESAKKRLAVIEKRGRYKQKH